MLSSPRGALFFGNGKEENQVRTPTLCRKGSLVPPALPQFALDDPLLSTPVASK